MNLTEREKRLVILIVPALLVALILRFTVFSDATPASATNGADSVALAQQRVARLRQLKALVPAREAIVKQTASDLALREKGLIPGDTAAQAQAALLQAARRVGKADQIEIRGGDFPAAKAFGDYGMVFASITFECHVEQLVNFLADLGRQPELMVPAEQRISAGQAKQKTMNVRIVLAGVVSKKLIPEKKGLAAF